VGTATGGLHNRSDKSYPTFSRTSEQLDAQYTAATAVRMWGTNLFLSMASLTKIAALTQVHP
jgi:hypothetical protein